MKKNPSNRIIQSSLLGLSLFASQSALANLDTDTANINLTVGLYASVTGLDDFTMFNTSGSNYAGSDTFLLDSNGSVRITATTTALTGSSVTPNVALDSGTHTFDTTANVPHNGMHTLHATVDLSGDNLLAAGNYTGVVTLTVSAI